jgi:hypothetical protein
MISERTALQIQILENLAAPLMAAVDAVAARTGALAGDAADRQGAEQVAALLGRTVQTSITLADGLKLKDTDDDAGRVALAALAARLVAAQYEGSNGKIPGDNDNKRVAAVLEAVLSFADNFAAGAEGRTRLELLDAGKEAGKGAALDETQLALQYVAALVPVVNEAAAFSFGRAEKKLVQDIADRLVADAAALRRDILGDKLSLADARRAELQVLRLLAGVYAACHRAETLRLAQMSPADREKIAAAGGGNIPMEPVWDAYGLRLSVLAALGGTLTGNKAADSAGPQPAAAPVAQAPAAPPPAPPPVDPSAVPAAAAAAATGDGKQNPMAFFKPGAKKATDDGQGG